MLTGELRSQIDKIWDAFWSGGISNPLEVMEHPEKFLGHLQMAIASHQCSIGIGPMNFIQSSAHLLFNADDPQNQ